jgi:hypothetical protein
MFIISDCLRTNHAMDKMITYKLRNYVHGEETFPVGQLIKNFPALYGT